MLAPGVDSGARGYQPRSASGVQVDVRRCWQQPAAVVATAAVAAIVVVAVIVVTAERVEPATQAATVILVRLRSHPVGQRAVRVARLPCRRELLNGVFLGGVGVVHEPL